MKVSLVCITIVINLIITIVVQSSLLSDRRAILYSTDLVPDTGNALGYHINLPCKYCLSQDNNGHFWMFRNNAAIAQPVFIEGNIRTVSSTSVYLILRVKKVSKSRSYPLYWGLVTTTDNNGGERYCENGSNTAEMSCKLAVSFSSCISLYVCEPRHLYIDAYGKDGRSCAGINVNHLQ
ncbi:hypothetical protein BY458DRAFT_440716 [Sporodiniella umbellata]|nr:hypothetical protein BY458DRAFT_440716 [Sporodiniella umbellata]